MSHSPLPQPPPFVYGFERAPLPPLAVRVVCNLMLALALWWIFPDHVWAIWLLGIFLLPMSAARMFGDWAIPRGVCEYEKAMHKAYVQSKREREEWDSAHAQRVTREKRGV